MSDAHLLVGALALTGALAAGAAPAARLLGARTGWVIAGGLAVAAAALATLVPEVADGGTVAFERPWLEAIGVSFALRLDALALLFALLVLVFGALVLAYCPAYVRGEVGRHPRFYGLMTAFTASMLALTLADDVWLFYISWELTTVTSFLLISHGGAPADRRAGTRAFTVTFAGGLCLLAGLLVAATSADTYRLSELLDGALGADTATAGAVLALAVAAAAAKSAQWPLHVWLPDAMVAPTPVSAYLHSAAMVKAGIYLLARFSPLVEGQDWTGLIVVLGLVTAVFGSAVALRRTDLKEILAYSTISQLGLIVALLGIGTFAAVAAALLHVIAHATYKAPLFLLTGAIDEATGHRDIGDLAGLGRRFPVLTAAAALAVASMAGLPPLLGFVSKEQALAELLGDLDGILRWVGLPLAVVAVTLTVAYAVRLFVAVFPGRSADGRDHPVAASLVGIPLLITVGALVGGIGSARLSAPISAAARAALGDGGELDVGLWHGATAAFWTSLAATAAGVGVVAMLRPWRRDAAAGPLAGPRRLQHGMDALATAGTAIGHRVSHRVPAWHLATIALVAVVAGLLAWVRFRVASDPPVWSSPWEEWAIVSLLGLAVAATIFATNRLAAVALLGVIDFLVVGLYVLHGGPDLALTQLMVDALTVALIVLVFRQLPRGFPDDALRRRAVAGVIGAGAGVAAGIAAYRLPAGQPSPLGRFFLEAAPEDSGNNVVNSILTDFRALDTVGELTVVAVAALGSVALIRRTVRNRS